MNKNNSQIAKVRALVDEARDLILRNIESAKRNVTQALALAKELDDKNLVGISYNLLGMIAYREGKISEALENVIKSERIYERTQNKEVGVNVYNLKGLIAEQKGEFDQAIEYYEKSLNLVDESVPDYELRLASINNNLSIVHWAKGDLEKALEYQKKSLSIKEKLGDSIAIGVSQNNLGLIYEDLGDWEKAVECFYRAIVEKEKNNDHSGIALCYSNLGEIYLKRDKLDRAKQLFEEALRHAEKVNSLPRKAEALGNLGYIYFLQGDFLRAFNYYVEDMNLSNVIDDKFELAETYWRMGALLLKTQELQEAIDFLNKAVDLAQTIGAQKEEAQALRVLGAHYCQSNESEKARNSYENAIKILESIGKNYELAETFNEFGRCLIGYGEKERGITLLRDAVSIFKKLEVYNRVETIERYLFQLEVERDRKGALLKNLTSWATQAQALPINELGEKCLLLFKDAYDFESGVFYVVDTQPYISGNLSLEKALSLVKRGVLEVKENSINLGLRIGSKELGAVYLRFIEERPQDLDSSFLETCANILSLSVERAKGVIRAKPVEIVKKEVVPEVEFVFEGIIGTTANMREVFDTILRVAPTKASVLLRGESGTGKELIARTIHSKSPRAKKPFIAINCAAITETLLESELFGIEKGTATGVTERKGKFELAKEGTIFLDEIGNMSLPLQAKILRVLQEKTFERVGGQKLLSADVRIIAATNVDLEKAMADGKFREDLYHRLNVVTVLLPPLRERRDDIPALTRYFIEKYNQEFERNVKGVNWDVEELFFSYSWPGNVRELENVIQRAVILTKGEYIRVDDLSPELQKFAEKNPPVGGGFTLQELKRQKVEAAKADLEKDFVLQLLKRANGKVSEAIKLSGVSRSQFYRLMAKYGIKKGGETYLRLRNKKDMSIER